VVYLSEKSIGLLNLFSILTFISPQLVTFLPNRFTFYKQWIIVQRMAQVNSSV
jgi:hypothetical protein